MPTEAITNPNLAFGYTGNSNRLPADIDTFKTSAVVTAARVLAMGTTGLVAVAATNGVAGLCVGVSIETTASGGTVRASTGKYASCGAEGAISAGDPLKRSATTAGFVAATAAPAAGELLGFAIAASAGGLVDMWINKG